MTDEIAYLNDREVMAAIEELEEATRMAKSKRRVEPLMRRLELSLRKAFREQGRLFVRGLSKFADRFGAVVVERSLASAFGDDARVKLEESVTPVEWMFVFYATTQKTNVLFARPIQKAVEAALKAGALAMMATVGMKASFDLANPRAVKYLQDYGARMVTKIDDTTRAYLQTLITQATHEGWSYKRTAEAIIERYQDFAVGRPQAHIDSRAHLVAVTETGNAYVEGNLQVAQELAAAGIEMEKYWSTVGDDKVSDGCRENEAAGWIGLDQTFPSGHQRPLRFPGCRCDLLTRRKK